MDTPPFHFARTDDGVNIAYWTLGKGPPVVILNPPSLSHLALEWTVPGMRRWYECMGNNHEVVRCNFRGTGLSPFTAVAIEIDEYVRDLETVIDAVTTGRVAILATGITGRIAAIYAARHPDRVDKLILFNAYLGTPDDDSGRRIIAAQSIAALGRDLWARSLWWWFDPDGTDAAQNLPSLIVGSMTPAAYRSMVATLPVSSEVDAEAGMLTAATLVVERRRNGDGSRRRTATAASIPGSRLVTVPGSAMAPYFQNAEDILQATLNFLSEEPVPEGLALRRP